MKSSNPSNQINSLNAFLSLDDLLEAHRELLKAYREEEITPEIAKKIIDFVYRGQATGAALDDDEARWDVQSRLDYWVALLQRSGFTSPEATLHKYDPEIELNQVINYINTSKPSDNLQILQNDLSKQTAIQIGKYIVNLSQGQNVHIGDRIYRGADAETIRQTVLELLEARRFCTLLTHAEFSDRIEKSALTSYQIPIVGRDECLQEIQQSLTSDRQVIILHGSAGLGKTRLLLALADVIGNEKTLWYVRNEAESIEPDLALLDAGQQHVLVLDDAHRFQLLHQLREVLVNPKLAGKVTLVLATRSAFQDSVLYQFNLPADQVRSIEIQPLENKDIDQILQNPPYSITDQNLRSIITRIAEGNPLIAGVAVRLNQRGIALANLTRDQVLTQYLDDIIKDLARVDANDQQNYQIYIRYLQVLAALGTIKLNEKDIQAKLYEVVGITPFSEDQIVTRLVEAGLIERYWQTLKIASEVLADHILIQYFFNPRTKQADYQKLIIEPFFNLKPREVLTSLAEAEFKGESSEAGTLLTQKLSELRRALSREGNLFRFNLLHALRDVAYLRPDDILTIVALIVDAPEPPPETFQDRLWGSYTIDHSWVLAEAVDVLASTIYRGRLKDAITYLYRLAMYRSDSQEYKRVREKATKALMEIAEFKLHKPYSIQLLMLESISSWLQQDFAANLRLSLALIQLMLKIDFSGVEMHPTELHMMVIHQESLEIVEPLRQIRDRALETLYMAYKQSQELPTRLQIVQMLCGATYHSNPLDRISDQTKEQLESDCAQIARFFSETVVPVGEFPILDRISEWLRQAKDFNHYQVSELDQLQQQLREHKGYQLYRLLVGGYRWDEEDEFSSNSTSSLEEIIQTENRWEAVEQRKKQKIQEYIEAISSATLEQVIQELEAIAQQARQVGKNDTFGLNDLLRHFGQIRSDLAQRLIEHVLVQDLELKQHLGFVLAGIRFSNQEVARAYVRDWIGREDVVLWVAIAQSYRFIDWSQPQLEEEWDILRQLTAKQSPIVDWSLFLPIRELAPYNSDLAVELLKILATRNDEAILTQVAEIVSWPRANSNEWAVNFNHLQDLEEIVGNFVRLSRLDYSAEQCLKRLGDVNPMEIIDLIERRIRLKPERSESDTYYEVFPKPFSRAFDSVKTKPEYPEILRRVRDWMLSDEFWLRFEAPALLKGIALNLAGELQDVLREWIITGDNEKLEGVARILKEFNAGQSFYDLSRELLLRTSNEDVLSPFYAAICTTPGVISDPMSNFYKKRLEEITPWLNDADFRVRAFANQVSRSLQTMIEREEAEEQFRERNW
jgi:hypothetical protein